MVFYVSPYECNISEQAVQQWIIIVEKDSKAILPLLFFGTFLSIGLPLYL